ncbi:MAG: hypothetical protein R3C03_17550 [Pirellulaceae bacterium]
MRDIEAWEDHYNFHEAKDYAGLVAYCEVEFKEYPNDLYAADRLANAYVLNGQYQDAIRFSGAMHHEYPTITMFHDHILDALFALGKTENDFEWLVPPTIVRISPEVREACYSALRGKRKPRSACDLRHSLWPEHYIAFTDSELLEYLQCDPRFSVLQDECYGKVVKLAPKTKSKPVGF